MFLYKLYNTVQLLKVSDISNYVAVFLPNLKFGVRDIQRIIQGDSELYVKNVNAG